jgi:hypothetical protein
MFTNEAASNHLVTVALYQWHVVKQKLAYSVQSDIGALYDFVF